MREQTLLAQPFDAGRAQTTGDPIPIAEQVDFVSNRGQGEFSASRDGLLAYRSGGAREAQLTWFDRSGRLQGVVGPPGTMQFPAISPEGRSVMIHRLDPDTGVYDLWRYDLARNTSARFTKRRRFPVWSPDGKQVAFLSNVKGGNQTYQKALDGTGPAEALDNLARNTYASDWARDGRFIVEGVQDPTTKMDIWVLPLFGDRKPFPYLQSEFSEWQAKLSPDGRWLAFKAGVPKPLFETRLPSGYSRFDVSKDGRFLIPTEVDSGGGAAVNIIVNWTAGLRK